MISRQAPFNSFIIFYDVGVTSCLYTPSVPPCSCCKEWVVEVSYCGGGGEVGWGGFVIWRAHSLVLGLRDPQLASRHRGGLVCVNLGIFLSSGTP